MSATNPASLGLTAGEVADVKSRGYRLCDHYEQNAALCEVIDFVGSWEIRRNNAALFRPITENLLDHDPFLLLADYGAYIDAQDRVSALWRDSHAWTPQSTSTLRTWANSPPPARSATSASACESCKPRPLRDSSRTILSDYRCSRNFSSPGA
jgi:glucan phosphorylase